MDRETIIKLAREAEIYTDNIMGSAIIGVSQIFRFAKLVAEHSASVEREAVLDLVDDYAKDNTDLRDAIRERSANAGARGNT